MMTTHVQPMTETAWINELNVELAKHSAGFDAGKIDVTQLQLAYDSGETPASVAERALRGSKGSQPTPTPKPARDMIDAVQSQAMDLPGAHAGLTSLSRLFPIAKWMCWIAAAFFILIGGLDIAHIIDPPTQTMVEKPSSDAASQQSRAAKDGLSRFADQAGYGTNMGNYLKNTSGGNVPSTAKDEAARQAEQFDPLMGTTVIKIAVNSFFWMAFAICLGACMKFLGHAAEIMREKME